jgi:ABC-2 type transport system permease protein
VVIGGFVLGFLAVGVVDYARYNAHINSLAARYTGSSVSSVPGFLGLAFSIIALALAMFAGTYIAGLREEEGRGHADLLLSSMAGRWRLVASRVFWGITFVVVLGLLTAVAAWAGTAVSGGAASVGTVVKGGLNVVPLVLLFGGLTLAAFGLVPRATTAVAIGAVGAGYGIQLIGAALNAPSWFRDISPFTHLAPVPAEPANTEALVVMVLLAAGAALAGGLCFTRRDIVSE